MFLLFSVITHHIPGYHQTWLCPLSSGTFHILPYFPMNFSQLEPPKMVNLQHIPSHLQHSSHSSHASNRDRDCWTHGLWARVMQTTWPQPQRCGYPAMAVFHGETGHENWCHGWFEEILPQYAMDKWTIRHIYSRNTPSRLYDSFVRESCHVSWWNIPITSISYDTSFGNFSGRPTVDFLQKLAGLSCWFITPIFQCFGESPSTEGNFRFVDQSLFEFFSSSENPHVGRISHGF